jgi:hypothetical protein
MKSFVEYLGCGKYNPRSSQDAGDFLVTRLSDITDKILPFFTKYPLEGAKAKNYADFCKAAEIMKQGRHLTEEGLEQIREIKAGMNTGRSE